MTAALCMYSATFMRYALAVTPKNYLLFGCHVVNFSAQTTQGYRFVNYWYMGGKDQADAKKAKEGLQGVADSVKEGAESAKQSVKEGADKVKEKVQ
jgi:hypothetical protein